MVGEQDTLLENFRELKNLLLKDMFWKSDETFFPIMGKLSCAEPNELLVEFDGSVRQISIFQSLNIRPTGSRVLKVFEKKIGIGKDILKRHFENLKQEMFFRESTKIGALRVLQAASCNCHQIKLGKL